jgi:hypothetical protein
MCFYSVSKLYEIDLTNKHLTCENKMNQTKQIENVFYKCADQARSCNNKFGKMHTKLDSIFLYEPFEVLHSDQKSLKHKNFNLYINQMRHFK